MTLKSDAKFEEKQTCGLENDMWNIANFHQSTWIISKLRLWCDPFTQSIKCMSLKFTEELCVKTMKNDAKFEKELTCHFKIDKRNLTNFDPSTQVSKICTLMGSFWTNYIMFELEKHRSYVWWQWRLMENLKESWLMLSKMTWEFGKLSPEALKNPKFRT